MMDSFPLEIMGLLRLAAVCSSALFLLVPAHTRAYRDVHTWWYLETEALGHFYQVKLMNIEDRPQTMGCVCLQV